LVFIFALKYGIREVQDNQVALELNGTYELFLYANDINLLGYSVSNIKENKETLLEADVGLEINTEKTKYMIMSRHLNSEENQNIRIVNESFENMARFKDLWRR
jgi:hypothetical protein